MLASDTVMVNNVACITHSQPVPLMHTNVDLTLPSTSEPLNRCIQFNTAISASVNLELANRLLGRSPSTVHSLTRTGDCLHV